MMAEGAVPGSEEADPAVDLARAVRFQHDFARRRAPGVVAVPGGFAVLDDRFPGSHDDNKVIVRTAATEPPGAAAERVVRAADEVLGRRAHRLVCVDDDRLGAAFAPAFAAAGYEHETNLIMAFRGETPAAPPAAERLTMAELLPVVRRDWRATLPQAPDEVVDGLARRVEARLRGADAVSFWGVRAPDGEIAARADLYVHENVAQIESVFTGEAYRGKGYARALMSALLGRAAEAELIFLVAGAADWPKDFYAGLGFAELGRTHAFLRA
ncbi:GNAT family N-acetyltransferase [Nonomuraea phyllanthi]|uniref:GNAT family N-acetyltransferase n=2 Tax=Nonomuraea phyllanthi TaxID=2219224 RepID=A0A8E0TEG5_9ACTN|nr:GNAT family N-acetyltransferase [Nonomuraea phyllanthi]